MSRAWHRGFADFLAVLLLVVGLASLQVVNSEKALLSSLCAYALIAVAALITIGASNAPALAESSCILTAGLFSSYVVARALTSPVPYHARADLYLALACAIIYTLTSVAFSARRRMALVVALLGFAVLHVLASAVQAGWGGNFSLLIPAFEDLEHSGRGTGLYVNPDHLAGLLELLGILGLGIACWSRWPKWSKVVVGYLTGVCYFGLALTGSRGGYLSAVTSLVVFALLSALVLRKGDTRTLLKFGGGGLFVLVIGFAAIWLFIQQQKPLTSAIENIFNADQGRLDLWSAAISQWHLRPWVGTGSGTYLFYGREFRNARMQLDPIDVHNDYLHLLCEYGVVGAVAFLIFLAVHLRNGWRSFLRFGPKRVAAGTLLFSDRLALNIGALSAISAYAVHSAVDFNMHVPANALLVAFVFGIIATAETDKRSESGNRVSAPWPKLAVTALSVVLLAQSSRLLPGEYLGEQARAALRDENPARAIDLAQKALAQENANPRLFFYLGRALVAFANVELSPPERLPLYERAIAAFENARRLAPLDESYPLELAFIYDQLHRFEEADAMYRIARERDPRSEMIAQMYQAHLDARNQAQAEAPRPD